jgi:hypothetical protein
MAALADERTGFPDRRLGFGAEGCGMNRRTFLGSIPLALAGCSRSAAPTPRADRIARESHLAMLESHRVAANAVRTTPKAAVDPLERFPELKPLARVAVRLHPRFGDEPGLRDTKLGGEILWPVDEDWPTCPEYRIPMAAVLQLRTEDAPPQFPMRATSDLFQLFWTPRATKAGPPHVVGVWRIAGAVQSPVPNPPTHDSADLGFVPVPCLVLPERQTDLPPMELMPAAMRRTLEQWKPAEEFRRNHAAARGTKAGGWPRVPDGAPKCSTCVHPMDYLLTVDSAEWTESEAARWKPAEDGDTDGARRAAGFDFGRAGAAIQIHLCRRCEAWPLRAAIV